MDLPQQICAVLFYQAEPVSLRRLAGLLKKSEGDTKDALSALEQTLEATGLRLIRNGDEVTLGTAPEAGALIEAITKEELSKELPKASLETLAIILYKGPVTRSEIDYIRGVNSTFILRNLLVRGLIERVENPKDQRSFLYKPTFELLEFMGVAKVEDLPNWEESEVSLRQFIVQKEEEEKTQNAEEEKQDDLGAADVKAEDAPQG